MSFQKNMYVQSKVSSFRDRDSRMNYSQAERSILVI